MASTQEGEVTRKVSNTKGGVLHQPRPEGTGDREYRDVPPARHAKKNEASLKSSPQSSKPSSNNVKVSRAPQSRLRYSQVFQRLRMKGTYVLPLRR
jgi:hypothetical protein